MEQRQLGQTDLNISPLGLGTVKFGRNQGVKYPQGFELPDEDSLADLLALAKDLGINMLDTAPAYGLSEERLGRLLKGQREDWIIIGKAGEEFENGRSSFDFSPTHIENSVERSLKRLGTDYIDALLIHSDGRDLDILGDTDLIETLHRLKKKGLIRAHGASTKTLEGGLKALKNIDIVMATYNPAYQDEEGVLDYATETGKGVLLKKALASGHIDKIGGRDPVTESLRFCFQHPGTSGVIIGTINPEHLRANVEACTEAIRQTNPQP